jgi:transposase
VSGKQEKKLLVHLDACHRLRNQLVIDRLHNRLMNKARKKLGLTTHYLNRALQYDTVKKYAREDTGLSMVHSQVRQNVAVRVDEGYKRFFDAVKEGKKNVHPPKCIDRKHYRSITYPQYGTAAHIKNSTLHLSMLGDYKVTSYRKIKGRPKTVTVKFKQGRWWAIVTALCQEKDVVSGVSANGSRIDVGIDTGLACLMTDSENNTYDPPKAWYGLRRRLRFAQKSLSRKFAARDEKHTLLVKTQAMQSDLPTMPYSNRLRKQIRAVAKIHTKIERVRDHHHKKNASVIASRYRIVAVEEHPVAFMLRNKKTAKLAADRSVAKQKTLLKSKLGCRYKEVPNARNGIGGNSQSCTCGASVPKTLSDRIHRCEQCGLVAGRDHVSANIAALIAFGFASLSLKAPAAGQAVVIRGEDKVLSGESLLHESQKNAASEPSVKRKPPVPVTTTGGEPTAGGKTPDHLHANRMSLTGEPNNHAMRIYPHKHVPQGAIRTTTPAGIKEQILGS